MEISRIAATSAVCRIPCCITYALLTIGGIQSAGLTELEAVIALFFITAILSCVAIGIYGAILLSAVRCISRTRATGYVLNEVNYSRRIQLAIILIQC